MHTSQNYLFEGNVNDNNDDAMFTEDAMDEFQKGSSDPESSKDIRRDEFIQKQIDIYQKNKPRPKPKTDRMCNFFSFIIREDMYYYSIIRS